MMKIQASDLKECFLIGCLSNEILEKSIIPAGRVTEHPKNSILFAVQDKVTNIHVILNGRINLSHYSENGSHNLQDTLLPTSILGLDLICTKTQLSPYMAIAAEGSRIFSFPADIILSPGKIPEAERLVSINGLLTMLSHLNMKKEYRIAALTHSGLRERIMTYLTMQARRRQTTSFAIPFSREEMASYLSVNRSALSHELSKMKQEGVIDFHHNQFSLL